MDNGQRTFNLWRSHWAPDTPPTWDSLSEKSKAAWAAVEAAQEERERGLREALHTAYTSLDNGADREDVKDALLAAINPLATEARDRTA